MRIRQITKRVLGTSFTAPNSYCCNNHHPIAVTTPHTQTTPFLLERIRTLTGGRSLASNIKLVKNNARVGSAIAMAYARATGGEDGLRSKL